MKYIIILFALIATAGCKQQTEMGIIDIDLSTASEVDTLFASNYFVHQQYIKLESNDSTLIGRPSKIRINQSNIYVQDYLQPKLLCYCLSSGKFINAINQVGRGPGEYVDLTDFDANEELVLLYDANGRKINFYSPNCNYLHSYQLTVNALNIGVDKNFAYLFHAGPLSISSEFYTITGIELSENKEKNKLLNKVNDEVPKAANGITFNYFESYGDSIIFWEDVYNYVYVLKGNRSTPYFNIHYSENHYSKKELLSIERFRNLFRERSSVYNYCFSDNFIFIKGIDLGRMRFYVYNRKTRELLVSKGGLYQDLCNGLFFWPKYAGRNTYCHAISIETLLDIKTRGLLKQKDLAELTDGLTAFDNPIIELLKCR